MLLVRVILLQLLMLLDDHDEKGNVNADCTQIEVRFVDYLLDVVLGLDGLRRAIVEVQAFACIFGCASYRMLT